METYIYIFLIVISIGIITLLIIQSQRKNKNIETPKSIQVQEKIINTRLQAYERFVLFLERSRPQSLLVRMVGTADNVNTLQAILLKTIRTEFEHNFSQQIYLSESSWKTICATKDNLVQMINISAKETTGQSIAEFSEKLLSLVHQNNDVTDTALKLLRSEARLLYNI